MRLSPLTLNADENHDQGAPTTSIEPETHTPPVTSTVYAPRFVLLWFAHLGNFIENDCRKNIIAPYLLFLYTEQSSDSVGNSHDLGYTLPPRPILT